MKKVLFSKATFICSAPTVATLPVFEKPLPEIAIIGRSNVGKSSLINHLFNQKHLAKTSATPGKTQMLNFFNIEDQLFLVDLPGYGYAQVSHGKQEVWGKAMDTYFKERKELVLILLLIDSRRSPSKEDIALVEWAKFNNKPLFIIFTKCDEVSQKEKATNTKAALDILGDFLYMHYTVKESRCRKELITTLNELLNAVAP